MEFMISADYDNPEIEGKWCNKCRAEVAAYLKREGVKHGRVSEWPDWHVAPYVSIWAVESGHCPDWVGWWVICGDLPTDYVSAEIIKNPREAMHSIAARWFEVSGYMDLGKKHPTVNIGTPETWHSLGPLLKSRAQLLAKWAKDDTLWEE
jgi:Domain of unknown function (DUF4826)